MAIDYRCLQIAEVNRMDTFNHNPLVFGNWTQYNGFVFNDWYDIRLRSGEIIKSCKVSSGVFTDTNGRIINKNNIKEVRLKYDNELPNSAFKDLNRLRKNILEFGVRYPTFIRSEGVYLYQYQVKPGEYLKPTILAAYRKLNNGSVTGGTYFIAAEGELVYTPIDVKLYSNDGGGIWVDPSEEILMPNIYAERLKLAGNVVVANNERAVVRKEIVKVYPSVPLELIDGFAGTLIKDEYVYFKNNQMLVANGNFKDSLDDVIESHIRYLNNYIATHYGTEILQKQRRHLQEMIA